ncbi:unnamed protein product [Symbiodinium sp. CCMP2592]|nr:unnamed protein product [Symbiodinium sp. CCMP2592]
MENGLGSMRKEESLETQLKEATSTEKCGVPNTTLQAIATATTIMEDCDMVMSFIWKILQETQEKEWRRIVKTMSLLEVILERGSERAIQDIRRDQWRIQQWKDFRFMEEAKDVGADIRSKAAAMLETLTDEEYQQKEKENAQKLSSGARLQVSEARCSQEEEQAVVLPSWEETGGRAAS